MTSMWANSWPNNRCSACNCSQCFIQFTPIHPQVMKLIFKKNIQGLPTTWAPRRAANERGVTVLRQRQLEAAPNWLSSCVRDRARRRVRANSNRPKGPPFSAVVGRQRSAFCRQTNRHRYYYNCYRYYCYCCYYYCFRQRHRT